MENKNSILNSSRYFDKYFGRSIDYNSNSFAVAEHQLIAHEPEFSLTVMIMMLLDTPLLV